MHDMTRLLGLMVEHEASDLYLTIDSPPMYRINGVLKPAGNKGLSEEDTEEMAASLMNDRQQAEFERDNEQNLGLHYESLGRFRLNVLRQRGAVALVIRRIKMEIPTTESLRLPEVIKEVATTKRGLVLVVGATGSGKSTSLAAMIDYRNKTSCGHIVTIEDPIEFIHPHKKCIISQREVGMDTLSYKMALKNALRQAPDVILLGEIRDTETMEAAIQFAETGHLCLATLHSNNANQAMERVMNFFPHERHPQIYLQLSLNLRGILSQRLVKTKDDGRVAAVEVLLDSPRVKDLILKGNITELKETMEKSTNIGMQSFDQALFDLYSSGSITIEEALKNADSANNLRLRVHLAEQKNSASSAATTVSPFKGRAETASEGGDKLSLDFSRDS
jgi:twitching motility protein PilU